MTWLSHIMCSLEVSIPKVYRDTLTIVSWYLNYCIVIRKLKMVSHSSSEIVRQFYLMPIKTYHVMCLPLQLFVNERVRTFSNDFKWSRSMYNGLILIAQVACITWLFCRGGLNKYHQCYDASVSPVQWHVGDKSDIRCKKPGSIHHAFLRWRSV